MFLGSFSLAPYFSFSFLRLLPVASLCHCLLLFIVLIFPVVRIVFSFCFVLLSSLFFDRARYRRFGIRIEREYPESAAAAQQHDSVERKQVWQEKKSGEKVQGSRYLQ